jgi:hypothetical protein
MSNEERAPKRQYHAGFTAEQTSYGILSERGDRMMLAWRKRYAIMP